MSRIPLAPLIKFLVFGVVTMLATVVLGLTIANAQSGDRTTYSARFTDASGLLPGDDVRIAGVIVGSVKDISVVDRTQALVDFEVDSGLRIPASATASVLYKNLIGQRFLSLSQAPGDPGAALAAGGQIPLDHTSPALDLTVLFRGFQPLFTGLDPDQINTLSNEIIQVLQGQGGTIDSLLTSTASLTNTLADRDQVIGQVIDNLNGVLDSVTPRNQELNDLIVSLRDLVSGLSEDRQPIGQAIASIGDLTQTTASLLQAARPDLKTDIAALGDLAGQLDQAKPVIEHYLQFAPYKLNKITRAGSYGSWFNFFLCGASVTVGITPIVPPVTLPAFNSDAARCGADPDGLGDEAKQVPPPAVPGSTSPASPASSSGPWGDSSSSSPAGPAVAPANPALLPALPALGGS